MINEILKLEANNNSIKEIKKYLNKSDVNTIEHAKAVSHLALLYASTNQVEDAINIINQFTTSYEKENCIEILNTLIKITKENKTMCLEAINRKKELLDSFELNSYYKDMIEYNKDNYEERIKYINLILQDDITKKERLDCLSMLAQAYHEFDKFDQFFHKLDTAKELSLELNNQEVFESFIYYQASFYYNGNDYEQTLDTIRDNPVHTQVYGNKINLLNIKIFFKQENYKKCSILEAKYEELMTKADVEVQKEFYTLCIKLYTLLHSKISVKAYQDKLDNLNVVKNIVKLDTIQEVEQIKTVKIKQQEKKEIIKQEPTFKKLKKVVPTLNEMSDFYQESLSIYEPFYIEKLFREQLRISLTNLNNQVMFNDCYIVTTSSSYHFKKERLYDKKEANLEITKSFNNHYTEIISFNTEKDNINNPFTNDLLEYNTATIFPLFSDKCVGAIYFTCETDNIVTGKLNFEKLHNFVAYFNALYLLNNTKETVLKDNESKLKVLENDNIYYSYLEDDEILSSKSCKYLIDMPLKTRFSTFLSCISDKDYINFHKLFNQLTLDNNYLEMILLLKNKKSILVKITKNSEESFIFIYEDYTNVVDEKEELFKLGYYDSITNLKNKKLLELDISNYFKLKKFGSFIINIKNLRKYSYLYDEKFSLDILGLIGSLLPKFNKDYEYYHVNFDKFIVVVKDTNDKRVIRNIIKKLEVYLTEELVKVNARLTPKFNFGVYRSFIDTKEQTLDKFIEVLSEALQSSSEDYEDNIGYYDIDVYKQRFVKEQLVTYISESIDQKTLHLRYTQCVNVEVQLVEFYEVKLNINKYKIEDYIINEVIKVKNLTAAIEQYILSRVFQEINMIYEKTSFTMNVLINIDEYSLTKESFVYYLNSLAEQNKINKKNIIIKTNKVYITSKDNIEYLIKQGFQIALSNIEDLSYVKPNYYIFKNFSITNVFNEQYIKQLTNLLKELEVKFVLDNTTKNSVIEHYNKDISYFKGEVYKQLLSYLDIVNIFKGDLVI